MIVSQLQNFIYFLFLLGYVYSQTNVAILMVEQNAKQALSISDRGYVLVTGENRYSGTGKELLNDPRVRSSFLGG